nr:MAG TPA: hypothetical protein [Caudoviricetes sp.]
MKAEDNSKEKRYTTCTRPLPPMLILQRFCRELLSMQGQGP